MSYLKQYAPNIIQLLLIAAINVGVYVASIQYMSTQIAELKADSKLYREELTIIRLQVASQAAINERVTKLEKKIDLIESENLRFWREDWPRIERIITNADRRN